MNLDLPQIYSSNSLRKVNGSAPPPLKGRDVTCLLSRNKRMFSFLDKTHSLDTRD